MLMANRWAAQHAQALRLQAKIDHEFARAQRLAEKAINDAVSEAMFAIAIDGHGVLPSQLVSDLEASVRQFRSERQLATATMIARKRREIEAMLATRTAAPPDHRTFHKRWSPL